MKPGDKRTPLGHLLVLPKLVNGKVAIVDSTTGTYCLHSISKYCSIYQPTSNDMSFSPECFTLLQTVDYTCIVDAYESEKTSSILNSFYDLYKEYIGPSKINSVYVGNRVHLKSKRGTYTVTKISDRTFTITCFKWRGEERDVPWNDFHCLAGGLFNHMINR